MATNPTRTDRDVQRIDVGLYFDAGLDREELLDKISDALQEPGLEELISAYELENDGFGRLLPGDKPLA